MLSKAGFELDKWTTNSWILLSEWNGSNIDEPVIFEFDDETENSVLGMSWLPAKDVFRYKITVPPSDDKVTKRKIVSQTAKLYDPIRYLAPITILAKVIIQKLWISKCGWDTKAPEPVVSEWKELMAGLPELSKLEIPRWIGTRPNYRVELHGFCDASEYAYGCALYVKVTDDKNIIRTNLVASLTRVAPINKSTIPRLELSGAHLLSNMLNDACETHNVRKEDCHLWSDSMIVLSWLDKPPTSAKVYVAHRVAETKEWSAGCTWRHVPTKENPADLASRGVKPKDIINNTLWWHGPEWLTKPNEQWPATKIVFSDEAKASMAKECSPPVVLTIVNHEPMVTNKKGDLLPQYSSITRLYRVTAFVRRFISNCRRKIAKEDCELGHSRQRKF